MVITEAELREAWRDGRGSLPAIPPDARLSPAARDFLAGLGPLAIAQAALATPLSPGLETKDEGGRRELRSVDGKRLILTAADVDDLVTSPPSTLVVHPSATLTDAARERLGKVGIRVVPWVEPKSRPTPATREKEAEGDDALYGRIKAAVLAKVDGNVDEALLDAVLTRVLASLR